MLKTRNLIVFSFKPGLIDLGSLQDTFADHALREPGPLEFETVGFVSPVSSESDIYARTVGDVAVFAVGVKKKVIPASVLHERVREKVKERAEKEHRKIGAKERKQIQEDIVHDLLRQAFVKASRTVAWIDNVHGWLMIDTSSSKAAELIVQAIRKAIGSFPAVPLAAGGDTSTPLVFLEWLNNQAAPDDFSLGDECVLSAADRSTWAGKNIDLVSDEVREHLAAGCMPARIGMGFNDRLTFVLDDNLAIRKFRLNDVALDTLSSASDESDPLAEFDAALSLVSGEVSQLIRRITEVFSVEVPA
jgi:recombination associated protein RdgC